MSILQACVILLLLIHTTNSINTYDISYEPNGEIIWRSTSDFTPQQSQSYGEIRLGQVMSIEFDFIFAGRNSSYINQFFRIGAAATTSGCTGQESKYPSMWLKYGGGNTGLLDIQFSGDETCTTKKFLNDYGALNVDASHHIKISLNNSNVEIIITGGGVGKISPYIQSWSRDPTPKNILGNYVSVWWMGDKYSGTYDPGLGTFSNIIIKTNIFTFAPTMAPTIKPTKSPTITGYIYPTMHPTTNPTQFPTTSMPTSITSNPTQIPTVTTINPTKIPSIIPTITPTISPTIIPTKIPTITPSIHPTITPTISPTRSPTKIPSMNPTVNPTITPTISPTKSPTITPTETQTKTPTKTPTKNPTENPTETPTINPIINPTITPTKNPTKNPTTDTTSTITDTQPSEPKNFAAKTSQDSQLNMMHMLIIVASITAVIVSCCIICGLIILYKQLKSEKLGPASPVFNHKKSMFASKMATTTTSKPQPELSSDPQIVYEEEEESDYITQKTTEVPCVPNGEVVDNFGGNIGDLITDHEMKRNTNNIVEFLCTSPHSNNYDDPEIPLSPGTGRTLGVTTCTMGYIESDGDTYYEDEYYDEVGDEFDYIDNAQEKTYYQDQFYDEDDGFDIETKK